MAQTAAKYLQYDNTYPVLVDYAKKDSKGNVIDETYLMLKDYIVATADKAGIVKVGYTEEAGTKKYKVQLDANSNMYVYVPWEDSEKATWTNVTGKPFSSVGDGLAVTDDTLKVDYTKVAAKTDLANYLETTIFNAYIQTTAPSTYVAKDGFKANYLDGNNVAYKSDLTAFITKDADNLTNYYTSSTVDNLLAQLKKNHYQQVDTKPTTGEEGIVYLVGTEAPYRMWIYEETRGWIDLGPTTLDLSGYVQGSNLTADKIILGNGGGKIKASAIGIVTALGSDNTSVPTSLAVKNAMDTALESYQKALNAGANISIDSSTNTISTKFTVTDVQIG